MLRKLRDMSWRTRTSFIILLGSIISVIFIYFQYVINEITHNNPTLMVTFFLFATFLVTDRASALASDFLSDIDRKKTDGELFSIPTKFIGNNDIVAFSTALEAIKYCTAVVPMAISVKNTVFRYGRDNISIKYKEGNAYSDWLKAKKSSLTDNNCTWAEIMSQHIRDNDDEKKFVNDVSSLGGFYDCSYIDENDKAIIPFIIFEFRGYKEVIFGWEFPTMRQGPCFLSRNDRVVRFFENYFLHCLTMCTNGTAADNAQGDGVGAEQGQLKLEVPLTSDGH